MHIWIAAIWIRDYGHVRVGVFIIRDIGQNMSRLKIAERIHRTKLLER